MLGRERELMSRGIEEGKRQSTGPAPIGK